MNLDRIKNSAIRAHYAKKRDVDYVLLEKLSRRLAIPIPMMKLSVVATDANGKVTGSYRGWSRTYNRNFFNHLFNCIANGGSGTGYVDGSTATKRTSGAVRGWSAADWNGGGANIVAGFFSWGTSTIASLGQSALGIAVGTGTAPESFNSFLLSNGILSGNGAGQLAYSAQVNPVLSWDNTLRKWTSTSVRIFNNNTASPITVTETCMYAEISAGGVFDQFYMFMRDLLAAPVAVAPAGQLTVTYGLSMTFPADVVEQPPVGGSSKRDQTQREIWDAWNTHHTPRHRTLEYSAPHILYTIQSRRRQMIP